MSSSRATVLRPEPDPPGFPVRSILGVDVLVARRDQAIAWLLDRMARRESTLLSFANTNLLNAMSASGDGLQLMRRFTVLNDGIGLDLASRWLYGEPFPDNLNGTDFTPALLAAAGQDARVFLFGARPEVVGRAAQAFAERHGCVIAGVQDGYGWTDDPDDLIRRINESGAQIVLVALGNPRQEHWMAENAARLEASLLIGVGALFDFTAGAVSRAPLTIQRLRLEWLYRLAQEPRRLARRYTVELAAFFRSVAAQKRADSQSGAADHAQG